MVSWDLVGWLGLLRSLFYMLVCKLFLKLVLTFLFLQYQR